MLKVGVVGGSGYTGVELLRILAGHPHVQLHCVTSRSEAGQPVSAMYPNLRGVVDLPFSEPDPQLLASCDLVFFATPNGVAMQSVSSLLESGVRVVDLSADFRIKDVAEWEKWYGMSHASPTLVAEAVYGLPEVNRDAIRQARLIANPGCYPTAIQLGFLPLLKNGLINTNSLIADAKSGVSGAGRKAELGILLCEASENFKAYGVKGHRHLPEIKQGLQNASSNAVSLTFVPHLVPMIRGIHATLYADFNDGIDLSEQALYELFLNSYQNEGFVDVLAPGHYPETRNVKGANRCQISVCRPQQGRRIVVMSVIDNLCKGAAGQAVQNMNVMFDLPENSGLQHIALLP